MKDHANISEINGLSEAEVTRRLDVEGFNEIPSSKKRSILLIAVDVVREPMFLLLVGAGLVYLVLGNLEEALMLLGFVVVVIGITIYQERKTERALEALQDLSSPRALVIRDGQQKRIAGREVVREDILVLSEGDRVPADGALLSCLNLSVDESLLTGESVPVRKTASEGASEMGRPGGEGLPFVFSGTMVVKGQGIAKVLATGVLTEMGKIGRALERVQVEETSLQKETRGWVGLLASVGLLLCTVVVVVYGLTRGNWLEGFLAGIATAMSLLPEELPVILTVFLALGAWRISQKRVLTRRVPAVETLGAATVLCVDKTGTITLNRMTVGKIFNGTEFFALGGPAEGRLPEAFHELVEFSILASQRDPFDPMEKAIHQLGESTLARTEHLHGDWSLVREYPLSERLLALSHVWKSPDDEEYVIAAKGAPEAISDLCHLGHGAEQELSKHIRSLADDGMRVLGVARAKFQRGSLPGEQHEFQFEFLGLVGLVDPVRPGVAEAVKECYTAGIRVVVITGDYPGTAQYVARQIGLAQAQDFITGTGLDEMDDLELQQRIRTVNIFARVVPEQKLRLVNALKANGEVVAMTGDGVNDAPALKSANIGIAMGGRGTDVAREASALVLLDDDFSSIVQAVRMGRRIFDNLQKAVSYTFAIHVPIAGLALFPVLLHWPLVLLPVHIVFLELIIDPACSVVFEAEQEEATVMTRPPRDPKKPLFSSRTIGLSVLQGASVFLIVLAVFAISLFRGQNETEARALTFTTLIVANLALIFTNRSWSRTMLATLRSPNAALWWVLGGAVTFLGLVLYLPWLRDLFLFDTLHPVDLAIALAAGSLGIVWFELVKEVNFRRGRSIAGS
ncbi:MAG: cation-translocating P-type ATPase [Dehalococcoidia bacterium]|nr:cation-translocating P-type ATPase [Dehalococcoidia bacterium]